LLVRAASRALNALASIASRDPRFVTIGRTPLLAEAGHPYDKQKFLEKGSKIFHQTSNYRNALNRLANFKLAGLRFAPREGAA
jgi:hypothetical protein